MRASGSHHGVLFCLGFGFSFAFGNGGDFFAGLGEFGFHVFPGGVEGGFVDGEVAEVDGLAGAGEAGGGFGGGEEGVAAPGGEVIDLAEAVRSSTWPRRVSPTISMRTLCQVPGSNLTGKTA